ncbi:MAG: type III pantothenate kinase, partial [Candidatus Omnitrophota bacterium]
MNKKLLAIDVGNTNINFGLFSNGHLIKKFIIPTNKYNFKLIKINKALFDDVIICSVVPKITKILELDFKKLDKKPLVLGKNLAVPIKNLYRKPKEVGQDRLVNAYAGIKLYGKPLIAIDFGTAITFDIISKNKEYLGGMILPGLNLSLEALNKYTALLPRIKLEAPREFIGRDTKNSMLSGIIYGFSSLTDDLIVRIKEKIGKNALVIGTGGNINLIGKYCRKIDIID